MATYTPSPGDVIAQGSVGVTELGSRVGGFIAGCGQAALLVILHAANGIQTTPSEVTALIQSSVSQHLTVGGKAAAGQSSPQTLKTLAQQHGVTLTDADPIQTLTNYSGSQDVLIGVNNASAFGGADSGVQGHYVTVVGKTASGDYIVSDPNSPESTTGQFVTYTLQQFKNSQPFWAGVASNIGGFSNPLDPLGQLAGSVGQIASTFGGFWSAAGSWITNPARILKVVVGVMLLQMSIGAALAGTVGSPILSAVGLPDVGTALGAVSKRRGAREAVQNAATARGKTIIERRTKAAGERGLSAGQLAGVREEMDRASAARRAARAKGEPKRKATVEAKKAAKIVPPPAPAPIRRPPSRLAQQYFNQSRVRAAMASQRRGETNVRNREIREGARRRMAQQGEGFQQTRREIQGE